MALYARRPILQPVMANPTIVVLTDGVDLDDQIFRTFTRCRDLLRQPPFHKFKREVAPGDLVFSFADTRIKAIGIALSSCYDCPKPP